MIYIEKLNNKINLLKNDEIIKKANENIDYMKRIMKQYN